MAIGMISKGCGFGGLLSYLLDPSKQPKIIGGCMFGSEPDHLARQFRAVANLRPRVTRPVRHLSIAFAPEDGAIDPVDKVAIALRVLKGLGYENCQYLVVDHHRDDPGHDTAHGHDHFHIVTSAVTFDGDYVRDSFDRLKIQPILREVEKDYGLREVACSWQVNFEKARATSLNSEVAGLVSSSLKDCSELEAWLDRLGQVGIEARFNLTFKGMARGVTYIKDGQIYKGCDVGASWSAVSGHFTPADDDWAVMLGANERCEKIPVQLSEIDRALFDRAVAAAVLKLGQSRRFESSRVKIKLEGDSLTVIRMRPHKLMVEAIRTQDGWEPVGFPNVLETDAQLLEQINSRRSRRSSSLGRVQDEDLFKGDLLVVQQEQYLDDYSDERLFE
jgi:Relaxase/Mobilisation nuclease domain